MIKKLLLVSTLFAATAVNAQDVKNIEIKDENQELAQLAAVAKANGMTEQEVAELVCNEVIAANSGSYLDRATTWVKNNPGKTVAITVAGVGVVVLFLKRDVVKAKAKSLWNKGKKKLNSGD